MKSITALLRPAGIFTLAVASLLTLDVAWIFARKANLAAPNNHGWNFAALATVPEKARAKHNPFENDPDAPAAGGKLFEQHCAECHGSLAEGGRRGPNLRAAEAQRATSGSLFWILTNGVVRRGMPVWSKLPEPQRWQLVTFLKSLGSTAAPPLNRDTRQGRPKIGASYHKAGTSW